MHKLRWAERQAASAKPVARSADNAYAGLWRQRRERSPVRRMGQQRLLRLRGRNQRAAIAGKPERERQSNV